MRARQTGIVANRSTASKIELLSFLLKAIANLPRTFLSEFVPSASQRFDGFLAERLYWRDAMVSGATRNSGLLARSNSYPSESK